MFSPSWSAPAGWYIGRLYEGRPNVVPDDVPLMRMSHAPTVPFTNLCGFNRLLRWPQHRQAKELGSSTRSSPPCLHQHPNPEPKVIDPATTGNYNSGGMIRCGNEWFRLVCVGIDPRAKLQGINRGLAVTVLGTFARHLDLYIELGPSSNTDTV